MKRLATHSTSPSLNWLVTPEIQEELRKEIAEFVGSGAGGEPTYKEYESKLPYPHLVQRHPSPLPHYHTIRQTTRLHPSQERPGWCSIFSFIEGSRICIGFDLAVFEYKVIMTT
ncbi:hypothetical protein FRC04_009949 [Tulasnella sp. 424]|nr:hypothetical protein FRC04_009949 [Tulasnella sp. 424]